MNTYRKMQDADRQLEIMADALVDWCAENGFEAADVDTLMLNPALTGEQLAYLNTFEYDWKQQQAIADGKESE